jgi:hypothetical protein
MILPACDALLPTPEIFPTDTPTVTVTRTATIQWFPATATPTPGVQRPQLIPTPDQRPALGEALLRDSFTDGAAWSTFTSAAGSIQVGKGQITFSAPEISANLVSLRRGVLPEDYYLEVTAATSLCRAKDAYGLAFRADGGAGQYRLLVSCDGFLRLERWRAAEAAVVQDWLPSGQLAGAGPQVLRLGLWLVGSEMRVFVNDVFQFSARDPLLTGQQLGLFLRSTGANATTVSFSELVVRAVRGYVPSPVPSATPVVTVVATRAPTLTPGK